MVIVFGSYFLAEELRVKRPRRRALRVQRAAVFDAELALAGAGRDQLVKALTVACTWSAWSMMRDELTMPPDDAREVMTRTMAALLMAGVAAAGVG